MEGGHGANTTYTTRTGNKYNTLKSCDNHVTHFQATQYLKIKTLH